MKGAIKKAEDIVKELGSGAYMLQQVEQVRASERRKSERQKWRQREGERQRDACVLQRVASSLAISSSVCGAWYRVSGLGARCPHANGTRSSDHVIDAAIPRLQ